MTTVISVENVSKYYRLGLINTGALHEDLNRWWAKVRGRPDPLLRVGQQDHGNQKGEFIWALRDVTLEVKQGEVLGIIGRNGAGKSTLLKILSRVTAPTSGQIKVKGRIASLLEVGTGFHQELTGRENVFLNGAILGMTKAEIRRKLAEIVEFSGVEKYIDTPVKRYSSGMHVRLAFAVAAHLDPEILVVDEVLAVGDIMFQEKCLSKMDSVSQEGRTVLLVSHNMGAILKLAQSCVLLQQGRVIKRGPSEEVVDLYVNRTLGGMEGKIDYAEDSAKQAQILSTVVRNTHGEITGTLDPGEPIIFELDIIVRRLAHIYATFMIEHNGVPIFHTGTFVDSQIPKVWPEGRYQVQMAFPPNILNAGNYTVWGAIAQWDGVKLHIPSDDALPFKLSEYSEVGRRGPRMQKLQGVLAIVPEYHVTAVDGQKS
jgi:lipopolysaccharide transport system ATP-binding protein